MTDIPPRQVFGDKHASRGVEITHLGDLPSLALRWRTFFPHAGEGAQARARLACFSRRKKLKFYACPVPSFAGASALTRKRPRVVTMKGNFPGRGASIHLDAYQGSAAQGVSAGDTGEVARILASFPGPVSLYPSRAKFFVALVVCLAFVAIASAMLQEGSLTAAGTFKVWFALIASGLCALVPAVMLLPGAASLTLDAEGFEQVTLYVKRRVSWRQVGAFTVRQYAVRGRNTRFIGYDDARLPADNANRRMIGRNAALPDTYRLSHDELASLMTQWRALALGPSR